MRPKFLMYLSIFVLIVIAILFWFRHSAKQVVVAKPEPETPAVANIQTTTLPSNAVIKSVLPAPVVPLSKEEIVIASNKAVELRGHQLQQMVEGDNIPLNFFAQVLDQDGQPLSGVQIKMIAVHNIYFSPESIGESNLITEKITDLGGRFDWTTGSGSGINIKSIKKDGYELEPNTKRTYSSISGNLQNPVIFSMWKTNIHEQLITGDKNFQIVPDGRTYFIDLTTDTIAEFGKGDLKVWVSEKALTNGLYDWSCEVALVDGSLLEETDPYSSIFIAPDGNYVSAFQVQQQLRNGQRGESGERRFYLKLKNGTEYGRMTIGIYAPYNDHIPGLIRLSYVINPSGSRILR